MAPHASLRALRHVQPGRLFTTRRTASVAIATSSTFTQRRFCAASTDTGRHASSSSQETQHTSSESASENASGATAQRIRMQTLGDYLSALPRGFRELLLYSPALALLCFVLYQQKTYFRDPGEAWYQVFNPWRSRRVGGWLLEQCDKPLPSPHLAAKPDTTTTSRVAISLCESEAIQDAHNRMGAPAPDTPAAPPTPLIAPFSSRRGDQAGSSSSADATREAPHDMAPTVWGHDVYAVRALRHDGGQGPVYGYEVVTVKEWQESCATAQKRGGWRAWARCLFAS